jgi:hypothetical protein
MIRNRGQCASLDTHGVLGWPCGVGSPGALWKCAYFPMAEMLTRAPAIGSACPCIRKSVDAVTCRVSSAHSFTTRSRDDVFTRFRNARAVRRSGRVCAFYVWRFANVAHDERDASCMCSPSSTPGIHCARSCARRAAYPHTGGLAPCAGKVDLTPFNFRGNFFKE